MVKNSKTCIEELKQSLLFIYSKLFIYFKKLKVLLPLSDKKLEPPIFGAFFYSIFLTEILIDFCS